MLSLIIPVFNEEGAVEDIIRRSHAVLETSDEIIVVDDGSIDATPGILKKITLPNLKIIRKAHNGGNGSAIMTGVRAAKANGSRRSTPTIRTARKIFRPFERNLRYPMQR